MKLYIIIACIFITGCQMPTPKVGQIENYLTDYTDISRHEYTQSINLIGKKIHQNLTYGYLNIPQDSKVVFLRANVTLEGEIRYIQFYLSYSAPSWIFLHTFRDVNGNAIPTTEIDTNVRSGGTISEDIAANLSIDYLEEHADTGFDFEVAGKKGYVYISYPAPAIQDFLSALNTVLKDPTDPSILIPTVYQNTN